MGVFVIAEAGVNHNGDEARALAMIDAARAAGADAVKFQTFTAEKVVSLSAPKAEYQKRETGEGTQYDMIKSLEMSPAAHRRLFQRSIDQGIEFMSTPFDDDAVELLVGLGVKRIKVPSGEIVNHTHLRYVARKNLPLIVSTGMATLEEVQEAIAVIADERRRNGWSVFPEGFITILHCTSNYPAACADVNLRAMKTIADATGLPVGYSDHTLGIAVSTAAVGLGAVVIEKHFTLDRSLPGPDHRASLEPAELAAMIRQIRDVEAALGSPIKAPSAAELPVRDVARRSVTASRDLPAGHRLQAGDLVLLRPGTGISAKYFDDVQQRMLKKPVKAGEPLQWESLE